MKIETAALNHGAPSRRVLLDRQTKTTPKRGNANGTHAPWAWAAALARYAVGRADDAEPKLEQEIETR